MSNLKKILLTLALVLAGGSLIIAQTTRSEKKLAKEAEIKKMLDAKTYTFVAQSVNPMRGWAHELNTNEYDLKITPDTVVSYLPFFGRAYVAPIYPEDGGIKFTSLKFNYTANAKKNGSLEVVIKPIDTKEIVQMYLSISANGYGTLSINSYNRDPISFYGYVQENKK